MSIAPIPVLRSLPRYTAENVSNDEHGETVGEDRDEDETSKGDDRNHHDEPRSEAVRCPAVDLCIRGV